MSGSDYTGDWTNMEGNELIYCHELWRIMKKEPMRWHAICDHAAKNSPLGYADATAFFLMCAYWSMMMWIGLEPLHHRIDNDQISSVLAKTLMSMKDWHCTETAKMYRKEDKPS